MKINKVLLNQNIQNKDDAFFKIAQLLKDENIIESEKEFIKALEDREDESTTGLIDGFAIPHGISTTVKASAVIYIRNTEGIEWESLDGSLVTDIIALAISKGENSHLDDLVEISTKLMDGSKREGLRHLENENEIINFFE